jgi:hypothetical protein
MVSSPDPFAILYKGSRLQAILGDAYKGPEAFPHGGENLVAEFESEGEDGYHVQLYETAMPARFFTIKATRPASKYVKARSVKLGTGSDEEQLAVLIAKALSRGMLDVEDLGE